MSAELSNQNLTNAIASGITGAMWSALLFLGVGITAIHYHASKMEPTQTVQLSDDKLGNAVLVYMTLKGYQIFEGNGQYNIIYLRGINPDGTLNDNRPDEWNDLRLVMEVLDGKPHIVGKWSATVEPGSRYAKNPMNPAGTFRIRDGQYSQAWAVGTHFGSGADPHTALVQAASVEGYRDRDRDGDAEVPVTASANSGINQHWGGDAETVGSWSAGCLVGQTRSGHREFMTLLQQDVRYSSNPNFLFTTTVIHAQALPQLEQFTGVGFSAAFEWTKQWEGKCSDHPNDLGGRTFMGITKSRAAQYGYADPCTLPPEKVQQIAKVDYWDISGCDRYSTPQMQLVCFDTTFNFGDGGWRLFTERGTRRDGFQYSALPTDEKQAARQIAEWRLDYRDFRVKERPDQQVFYNGWIRRDKALIETISE